MSKYELSRRDLLKGLGVGLGCLPVLQASTSFAQNSADKRLLIVASTEGYRIPTWLPGQGALGTLPECIAPLEPFKNDIAVYAGMGNPSYTKGTGHQAYGTIYCAGPIKEGQSNYDEPMGPTIDQMVAEQFAKGAGAPSKKSLHLATQLQRSKMKGGYPPGGYRCFWEGENKPITPEENPYKVFGELFTGRPTTAPGMPVNDPAADKLRAENKSLLDYVGGELERFGKRLGREDKASIDQHLGSIRAIERQLTTPKASAADCGAVKLGAGGQPIDFNANANYPAVMNLHFELMVAALKCNVTRVATLQLASGTGNDIVFDFVPGVPRNGGGYRTFRDWHDLGHQPVAGGVDHKKLVDKWCMSQFAVLLKLMKEAPVAGGTLLDVSLALWGNHQEDGANHNARKIPWVVAGHAGGFKTGHCAVGGTILSTMAEMCRALDTPTAPFMR